MSLPRAAVFLATAILLSPALTPHGNISKPFLNSFKLNATTRGAAGGGASQLYMMQPGLHVTGVHQGIGFEIDVQDEESSTAERIGLSFVKFAADGVEPDVTPGGEIVRISFNTFGFLSGRLAVRLLQTWGSTEQLPARHGVGAHLPAEPAWPADGLSIQGQLNLPNDPKRPRVLPPHAREVWAFERAATELPVRGERDRDVLFPPRPAVPLGGRALDCLGLTPSYTGSILQLITFSTAYGGGGEQLLGPESLYPVASRGDQFLIEVHGRSPTGFPLMTVFMAPQLRADPVPIPAILGTGLFYLDQTVAVQLQTVVLDVLGKATIGPFPIAAFPPGARDWYFQGVNQSLAGKVDMTDVAGFAGQ